MKSIILSSHLNIQINFMSDSLAMGISHSPFLAGLYLHYFKIKMISFINFPFYCKYVENVDESFVLLDLSISSIESILAIFNSDNSVIQFTYKIEVNNELSFLEVLFTCQFNICDICVYHRPYHKPFLLQALSPQFNSHLPPS